VVGVEAARAGLLDRGPADIDARDRGAGSLHEVELTLHFAVVDVLPEQMGLDAAQLRRGRGRPSSERDQAHERKNDRRDKA